MSCRRVSGGLCPGQHFSGSGMPGGAGSHPAEPLGLGQMAAGKLRLAQSHRPGFGNPAMHGPRKLHAHEHLGEWMVQPCPYLGCGSLNLGFRFRPPPPAPCILQGLWGINTEQRRPRGRRPGSVQPCPNIARLRKIASSSGWNPFPKMKSFPQYKTGSSKSEVSEPPIQSPYHQLLPQPHFKHQSLGQLSRTLGVAQKMVWKLWPIQSLRGCRQLSHTMNTEK